MTKNFILICRRCLDKAELPFKCHVHLDANSGKCIFICYKCGRNEEIVIDQVELPTVDEKKEIDERIKN